MPQIFNLQLSKHTFFVIGKYLVLSEDLEHHLQMRYMIQFNGVVHQNIVKRKTKTKRQICSLIVYERLKGRWGVGEAKQHDQKPVMSVMRAEGYHVDI